MVSWHDPNRRRWLPLLVLLFLGTGCNIIRKPARLDVQPIEAFNPVKTQHIVVATVTDEKGHALRNREVQWMLEGVGSIVEVGGHFIVDRKERKIDNSYAVSRTQVFEKKLDRDNGNPADDIVIKPGQAWCVITSPVEGDAQVTAFVPGIANWDHRTVSVVKHWIDAEWRLPPPCTQPAGTPAVLSTQVYRFSDRRPLAGYHVRYRILDGPPAVFLPSQTTEASAVSDLNGNAHITLAQSTAANGVNHIAVEIIRAPDSTAGTGIIVGRGETTAEFVAPAVGLVNLAPASAAVGQDIPCTLTVRNPGKVDTQEITLRQTIPDGLEYVRSEPPAIVEGNQLIWTLAGLPPGQVHTVQAVFRSPRPGTFTHTALVTTREGLRDEKSAVTQVSAAQLQVRMAGPATAAVGQPIIYQISVTNPGGGSANNVVLLSEYDAGLDSETGARSLRLTIGTLPAGETRSETLTLTARQSGRLINRISATADGNLRANAEHAVDVQQAQLKINLDGPAQRFVNRPADFTIRVSNPGDTALNNVQVRFRQPPELAITTASEGGAIQADGASWQLPTLGPGEERTFTITANCLRIAAKALTVAQASAGAGLSVQDEAVLEISGLPAFRLNVQDTVDPIPVGGRTTYQIEVLNEGTLPGNGVEITCSVPAQLKVVNASGPIRPRYEGTRVIFPALDALPPGQRGRYSVDVEAVQPGDARFIVELRAATLREPVIEEESTNVLSSPPP